MEKMISVRLVRLVVPVTGTPGDHLMILGDVCVGVDTSRPTTIIEGTTRAESTTRALPAPRKAASHPKKRRSSPHHAKSPDEISDLKRRIMDCFDSDAKMRTGEIHQKLGTKPGDDSNIYYYLDVLVAEKALRVDTIKSGGRRLKRYWKTGSAGIVRPRSENGTLSIDIILSKFKPDEQMTSSQVYSSLGLRTDSEKVRTLHYLKSLVEGKKLTAEKSPNPAVGYIYQLVPAA